MPVSAPWCMSCNIAMVDAGNGIGFYCPNPECKCNHLTIQQAKQIVSQIQYSSVKECTICGSKDKKPTAKYCKPCNTMISEECRKINKKAWKQAIEIVKNRIKENKINGT